MSGLILFIPMELMTPSNAVIKRLGRTLWKKWSGYHRRSLVETKMHCIKLLGDKLSARSFDSQVNEIHARVAVLNRFTELGRPLIQVTP